MKSVTVSQQTVLAENRRSID